MPSIQKLQAALVQSQQWASTFREEIKKLMQQMSTKREQMTAMWKQTCELKQSSRKAEVELKALLEQKQREGYRRDKVMIKVEELQARTAVYQDGLGKKQEWNRQLTKKAALLQQSIQQLHSSAAIDDFSDAIGSQSKISISSSIISCNSNHSQSSSRKSVHPMIESNLSRLRKLEGIYSQLSAKCRLREEEVEQQKRKQTRLRAAVQEMERSQDDKENVARESNPAERNSKETRTQLARVKQLQQKNEMLSAKLKQQRRWVQKYTKNMLSLAECEAQAEVIRGSVLSAQRQARKERKTIETICSYMLKENGL